MGTLKILLVMFETDMLISKLRSNFKNTGHSYGLTVTHSFTRKLIGENCDTQVEDVHVPSSTFLLPSNKNACSKPVRVGY